MLRQTDHYISQRRFLQIVKYGKKAHRTSTIIMDFGTGNAKSIFALDDIPNIKTKVAFRKAKEFEALINA